MAYTPWAPTTNTFEGVDFTQDPNSWRMSVPDSALQSLGYNGPRTQLSGNGDMVTDVLTPEVQNLLSQYSLGQNQLDQYTTDYSLLDSGGNPVGSSWQQNTDPAGDLRALIRTMVIAPAASYVAGANFDAAGTSGVTNGALADSAVGSSGYGASSVGAGDAAYAGLGGAEAAPAYSGVGSSPASGGGLTPAATGATGVGSLGSYLQTAGKLLTSQNGGAATGASPQAYSGLGGGGRNSRLQQQILSETLRGAPAQQAMPGWIPGG